MNGFKRTGLYLLATTVAWLSIADNCAAQTEKYLAIDTVEMAGAVYDSGAARCDESMLIAAAETYLRVRDILQNDPALGMQYQKLMPKIAYMLGWCHHRRAEITGAGEQIDLTLLWFGRVPEDAEGQIGVYAKLMVGEISLRLIVSEKYDLLCRGALDEAQVLSLGDRLTAVRDRFSEGYQLLDAGSSGRRFAATKTADAIYELARLHRTVGNASQARDYYDSVDYSTVGSRSGDSNAGAALEYNQYCDALVQLEIYLQAPEDFDDAVLGSLISALTYRDRALRRGAISLAEALPTEAVEYFETAASLGTAGSPLIPEAEYFRGCAFLDSAVVDNMLHNQVVGALRDARESFESFEDSVQSAGFNNDARLRQLVTRARHKYQLLGVSEGRSMSNQQLATLGREDVKFLIRIAASIVGTPRARCTATLRRYFDLQDQRRRSGNTDVDAFVVGPCAARTEALSLNETLFLRGLVISFQAEAYGGEQRFATFDEAATVLDSVRGDYEGEAKYVQAYALYKAEKYDEADYLLKKLITDYHSVRALYYYGMNLRDWYGDEGTDTVKTRIYASMQKTADIIESAGQPPEYRNFLSSTKIMLDEYQDYFTSNPDADLNIPGTQGVVCPDILSVDMSGSRPDTVLYENMADKKLIRDKFAQESREDFAVFGLPKLWLHPTSRSCEEGPLLALAQALIPDSVHLERVWRGRMQIVDADGNILRPDSCWAEFVADGSRINCKDSAGGRYIILDADIKTNDIVSLEIIEPGFYRTLVKFTADEPGYADRTLVLARMVNYEAMAAGSSDDPFGYTYLSDGSYGFKLTAHQKSETPPSRLVSDFNSDRDVRDYAYDQANNRFLAVSSQLNNGLISVDSNGYTDTLMIKSRGITVDSAGNIYIADSGNHRVLVLDSTLRVNPDLISVSRDGRTDTLTIISRDGLNSAEGITVDSDGSIYIADWENHRVLVLDSTLHVNPDLISVSRDGRTDTLTIISRDRLNSAEGITVDRDGNIYVADWGNHRIVALDHTGRLRFTFGAFGKNVDANSAAPARLVFPNRITIEQEPASASAPRQTHILVSDWHGVHRFDWWGRYLDSPVSVGPAGLDPGMYQEITLDGYGPGSDLRIHPLGESQPRLYSAPE